MENIPRSRARRLNIDKMSFLPKAVYRFNAIYIRIAKACLTEIEKTIQNSCRPTKDPEQTNQF